ncbi:hypothetical protein ACQKP3_05465 [Vibrio sp. DNB22_10_4]
MISKLSSAPNNKPTCSSMPLRSAITPTERLCCFAHGAVAMDRVWDDELIGFF